MLQNTTRSIQQDHCSLWKQSLQPIARLALTLIAVLFMVGLSFAFVNQNNVAHAADIQSMDQPATSVQAANENETTESATTAPDGRTMNRMHKHAILMPAKYVTINGDVRDRGCDQERQSGEGTRSGSGIAFPFPSVLSVLMFFP
jgi:hypothetical protein